MLHVAITQMVKMEAVDCISSDRRYTTTVVAGDEYTNSQGV